MTISFFKLAVLVLSVLLFVDSAYSHSFLLNPRASRRGAMPTKNGCQGKNCLACPKIYPRSQSLNNSLDRPEATWERGQVVNIRWAKNNHLGGFVRLAFVPVDKLYDVEVHDKLAFYYGCWYQGLHRCSKDMDCAADKKRKAFQREITVPSILPDGKYVFAFIWYGGIDSTESVGQFADFPSCAYITVSGGAPLTDSYQPFFDAGYRNSKKLPRTQCKTYIDEPHLCTMKPLVGSRCANKKPYKGVPKPFQNGNKPDLILRSYYEKAVDTATFTPAPFPSSSPSSTASTTVKVAEPSPTSSPTATMSASASPSTSPSPTLSALPSASASSTPSESVTLSPTKSEPLSTTSVMPSPSASLSTTSPTSGICVNGLCCESQCGKCMNRECASRPGGRQGCCPYKIRKKARSCDNFSPPCVVAPSAYTPPPTTILGQPAVCKSNVCCPAECGRCGGPACAKLPGGRSNCCRNKIRETNRSCEKYPPPCRLPADYL